MRNIPVRCNNPQSFAFSLLISGREYAVNMAPLKIMDPVESYQMCWRMNYLGNFHVRL